jgi:hypothetical protein
LILTEIDEDRIEVTTEHAVNGLWLLKTANQIHILQVRLFFIPTFQNVDELVPVANHLPPG